MMVLRNIILVPYMWIRLCWHATHVDKYTLAEHFKILRYIVAHANKGGNVKIESYGKEMLKAGTDISDFTPFQVINIDSKEFNDKNAKFEISQVNAVDLDSVFSRQSELEDAINKEIKEKNLDFYMFAATDILNANSKIIAIGNKADTVEKAFGVNLENNTAMLNNVVSRKKQMIPVLVTYLQQK